MDRRLAQEHDRMITDMVCTLQARSRYSMTTSFIQHGHKSVFEHSVAVAYCSCNLARLLHLRVDYSALIRAALLHDYFLYDWHDKDKGVSWHGFRHPAIALSHAQEEFSLSRREEDAIARHMFPLTLTPPKFRESWLVCIADKLCALKECCESLFSRFLDRKA